MAGFPIAVGTGPRNSSSRPFPLLHGDGVGRGCGVQHHGDRRHHGNIDGDAPAGGGGLDDGQNSGCTEVGEEDDVIMTIGSNEDETFVASVFIKYHFLPISSNEDEHSSESSPSDATDVALALGGEDSQTPKGVGNGETNATNNDGGDSSDEWHDNCKSVPSNNATVSAAQSSKSDTKPVNLLERNSRAATDTFNVIAELRVQITSSTKPFASSVDAMSSRETKCKVPLGVMKRRRADVCGLLESDHSTQQHQHQSTQYSQYTPNSSVVFSANHSHLACLIPLPRQYHLVSSTQQHTEEATSTLVVFRLQSQSFTRQQKMQQQKRVLPPLPDYIVEKVHSVVNEENSSVEIGGRVKSDGNLQSEGRTTVTSNELEGRKDQVDESTTSSGNLQSTRNDLSYVAHEPRIVRVSQLSSEFAPEVTAGNTTTASHGRLFQRKHSGGLSTCQTPPLQSATSLCTIPTDHHRGREPDASSMLLVGTVDGSLLLVNFSLARVHSTLLDCRLDDGVNDTDRSGRGNPIVHIAQCPSSLWKPLDAYGEEQGSKSKGRIAIVGRDGSVNVYSTSFVVPSTSLLLQSNSSNVSDTEAAVTNRIVNERAGELKHKSLELILERMSTFSASDDGATGTKSLRYSRAKWLNPLMLVLLTRSPCLDENVLSGKSCDGGSAPVELVVAQVWAVVEIVDDDEIEMQVKKSIIPSSCKAHISLVSELKWPHGEDDLEELAHDTFSLLRKSLSMETSSYASILSIYAYCDSAMAISYHKGTDCLALSSIVVSSHGLMPSR